MLVHCRHRLALIHLGSLVFGLIYTNGFGHHADMNDGGFLHFWSAAFFFVASLLLVGSYMLF